MQHHLGRLLSMRLRRYHAPSPQACCVTESAGRDGGDLPFLRSVIDVTAAALKVNSKVRAGHAEVPGRQASHSSCGCVHPQRIYLVGIANGGFMAMRAACDAGVVFAGIVAYAAGIKASQCTASDKVPMLLVHGSVDVIVPFAGGTNSAGVTFPGFTETRSVWAQLNGCSGAESSTFTAAAGNDQLVVKATKYATCTGAPLETWEIDRGQHFALADTSAVIFQKALREFLLPRSRA
jgi:hypothetical protein